MKKLIKATIAGAVAVNVSVIVIAQTFWGPEAYHGNVGRGAKIAAWGTSKGVASCSSCHGYDGVGNGYSRVPRLAGQSSAYLVQQLDNYASGKRNNIFMANFAQRLSDQERADVAAYYASLRSGFPPPESEIPQSVLERGRQLANFGDDKLTVQSCNDCHGPQGAGEFPDIPALKGQYSNYIVQRLQQLAATHNDADLMFSVASDLGAQDMQAVAAYYEQLANSGVH
ncbi:MAG: cytochrome c4 [Verrucomicrobia bacterium]|nr:cytochrome c4 [Verrucomicrobiota bacterium]